MSEANRIETQVDPPKEPPISRGICFTHCWGAPPGKDDLECPYCNGTLRTKS